MRSQNNRCFFLLIVFFDEIADFLLRHDVKPDGRLVQKQHFRFVKQCRDQFAFHPLAQRKFAHLYVKNVLNLKKFN